MRTISGRRHYNRFLELNPTYYSIIILNKMQPYSTNNIVIAGKYDIDREPVTILENQIVNYWASIVFSPKISYIVCEPAYTNDIKQYKKH